MTTVRDTLLLCITQFSCVILITRPKTNKNKQTKPCTYINLYVLSYKSPGAEIFPPGRSERGLCWKSCYKDLGNWAAWDTASNFQGKRAVAGSCQRESRTRREAGSGFRFSCWSCFLLLVSQCTRSSGLPSAEPCHLLPPWAVLQKCAQGCPCLQNTEWSRHTQTSSFQKWA